LNNTFAPQWAAQGWSQAAGEGVVYRGRAAAPPRLAATRPRRRAAAPHPFHRPATVPPPPPVLDADGRCCGAAARRRVNRTRHTNPVCKGGLRTTLVPPSRPALTPTPVPFIFL
jgi:hypothetical protein